jgi:hypothetical protein
MISLVTGALSFLAAVGVSHAYGGVDVSQRTGVEAWQCLAGDGNSFAIVRVYCSSGHPDDNGPATINDAWTGGMSHVDGYIFPCYSCGNAAQQMVLLLYICFKSFISPVNVFDNAKIIIAFLSIFCCISSL